MEHDPFLAQCRFHVLRRTDIEPGAKRSTPRTFLGQYGTVRAGLL